MIYAVIIGICLLLVLSYVCSQQYLLSPSVMVSTVWLVVLALYVLISHDLFPIGKQTLSCLLLWCSGIVLSSLFVQSFSTPVSKAHASHTMRDVYLLISVATFPLMLYWAYKAIQSGSDSWAMNLRLSAIGKGYNNEVYTPFYAVIWQVSYALELLYLERKKLWRLLLAGFLVLAFCLVTMSKTFMLCLFTSTICILFFNKKIQVKHLVLGLLGIIAALTSLQALRDNWSSEDNSQMVSFVELYMLSSLPAFETINPSTAVHWGENVFRIIYAVSYKLGFGDIKPINPILEFTQIPIYTNTYTAMYPFFVDFGYWGVAIFAIVIGIIFGFTFRKTQDGDNCALIIYAYMVHIVIVQFMGDMLFTNLAGFLKYIIVAIIPFAVEKSKLFYVTKE